MLPLLACNRVTEIDVLLPKEASPLVAEAGNTVEPVDACVADCTGPEVEAAACIDSSLYPGGGIFKADFSDVSDMTLNRGAAALAGGAIRLVSTTGIEEGSAYFTMPVPIRCQHFDLRSLRDAHWRWRGWRGNRRHGVRRAKLTRWSDRDRHRGRWARLRSASRRASPSSSTRSSTRPRIPTEITLRSLPMATSSRTSLPPCRRSISMMESCETFGSTTTRLKSFWRSTCPKGLPNQPPRY